MAKNDESEIIENIEEATEEYVKKVKKKLKKAKKEAKEYLDGWQRERANFVNYKKDIEKYIETARDNVKEEVLTHYINTIDNIELMLKHADDAIRKSNWYGGVQNAHKHAINALKGLGVEEIPTKSGDKFNPQFHEAVEGEGEGEIVYEVVQKGYKLNDKIIRPVKVRVKN